MTEECKSWKEYKFDQFENNSFDYLVDIGACVGDISSRFAEANPNAEIFAYEPCISNYKTLVINTKKFPNVITFNKALGNGNYLYFKDSRREERHMFLENNENHSYKIQSITLYDIIFFHSINLRKKCAIKVDCEGGERFLLNDKKSEDIIKRCFHFTMEVHFKHAGRGNPRFNHFPEWEVYDNWINGFKETHNITYWYSNRHNGVGVYVLSKKETI